MSATARAATARPRTVRRPATPARTARRRPVLTEVPPAPATVAGNGVFALVVVGLLVVGMGVLLGLNTSLAQGAFEISALTRTQNALAIQEQQLLQQVAVAEAPESLQQRADALGMVPVASPVFLRLADGAVLGTPVPAVGVPRARRAATTLPVTGGQPATTAAAAAPAPAAGSDAAVPDAPSGKPTAATAAGTARRAGAPSDAAVPDPGTGRAATAGTPVRTGR